MKQRLTGLCVAFAMAAASSASAATIVDTGGSASQVGYQLGSNQWLAARFSSPTTILQNLSGFIGGHRAVAGQTFYVALYAGGGNTPGTELYSAAAVYGGELGWHGVSNVGWAVTAADYFVAFEVRPGDTLIGSMPGDAPSPLGVEAFSASGAYQRLDSLNIGVRIDDNVVGAIPEPATWALLIVGFGAVGASLRRSRRRARTPVALGA